MTGGPVVQHGETWEAPDGRRYEVEWFDEKRDRVRWTYPDGRTRLMPLSACVDWKNVTAEVEGGMMRGMARGRPPQDDVTRDRMVRVRVTADQETRWRVAADAAGLDLSTWLRELADEAAAKESGR